MGEFMRKKSIITKKLYAPPGEYIKDHCLIRNEGLWHLFSISGHVGHAWMDIGNEEKISHSTSPDLIHWEMHGHPVKASGKEGYYDEHMAVAPFVMRGLDGRFYMFYSGWRHPNKRPDFNLEGHLQSIYMAVSDDLYNWEIPDEIAPRGINVESGGPIIGRDPHVIRDEEGDRWLLYYTRESLGGKPSAVGVAQSRDLKKWRHLSEAIVVRDHQRSFDPCESPFVLKHPVSGKYILFLNWDYSISEDPIKFPTLQPLPFPCGIASEGLASVGVGYAREFIEHDGNNYLSCVLGQDGYMKLGFMQFKWTEDFIEIMH